MSIESETRSGAVHYNPLESAPVGGLIRKYAIPSIISLLIAAIYNISDQIFIGHAVGWIGNAATTVAFPISYLSNALTQLIGIGAAVNFNINMGARKPEEARKYVGHGLALISILGVTLMCILLLFKTPILLAFGATKTIMPYADMYLGITAFGYPFLIFTTAGSQLIRADGSPKYAMFCTVFGALFDVFLNWLFIFQFGWGIMGAASSNVIAQFLGFAICVAYFPRFKAFKIGFDVFRLKLSYIIKIAKLGISNFFNQIMMMLVNVVMNNTLTHYGASSIYGSDKPLAVAGVILKLYSILVSFAVGTAQGCQPILGFNIGAKNYARVKETYKKAFVVVIVISILAFIAFQTFPRQMVSIFGSGETFDDLYFDFAERYMKTYMFMIFVFGIQPLTVNYFTSIGYPSQGIVLSLSRQGFFLIPLLIVFPLFWGLDGALYAGPVADAMACLLSLFLMFRNFRKLTVLQQMEG